MNLIDIFKQEPKKVVKSNLQKTEKNQLEKAIDGADLPSTNKTVEAEQVVKTIK